MLDWFISIKGQDFLVYFWTLSILAIFIGKWLMSRADGSKHFSMPSPTQLNTYEIAALREERKGVIHTALFNLWNAQLIEVSGKNQDAQVQITSKNNLAPKNSFEAMIYRFIAQQPRNPKEFFNQASFHSQMDAELETVYQKLEKLHLRRTEQQSQSAKKIFKTLMWLIFGIGGTKLIFGFFYGRPLTFLVLSMFAMFIIMIIVFSGEDSRISTLGKRYLQALNKHFEWVKTKGRSELAKATEQSSFDPALRVAIFGISGLAGFAIFSTFQEAFAASATSTVSSESGGGGCGGGCGGGSDGGGGGCGGCGGGGD